CRTVKKLLARKQVGGTPRSRGARTRRVVLDTIRRLCPGSPYHKPDCYPVDAGFTPPLGLPGHRAGVKAVLSAAQRVEITLAFETTRAVPRPGGWSGSRSSGKCPLGCLGWWTAVCARGQSACLTRSESMAGAARRLLAVEGRDKRAARQGHLGERYRTEFLRRRRAVTMAKGTHRQWPLEGGWRHIVA